MNESNKKILGRLPLTRGNYDPSIAYDYLNDVFYGGSTFRSKVDYNTNPPCKFNEDGSYEVHYDWQPVAIGSYSPLDSSKIDNLKDRVDEFQGVLETQFNKLDNTSDLDKPISNATNGALNVIRDTISSNYNYLLNKQNTDYTTLDNKLDSNIDDVKGIIDDLESEVINNLNYTNTKLDTKIDVSTRAVANGVATLDTNGLVPTSQLNPSIISNRSYKGIWDASTNTPNLTTVQGSGFYYIVSKAGTQFGTTWAVDDTIISNGTIWEKISGNLALVNSKLLELEQDVDNAATAANSVAGRVTTLEQDPIIIASSDVPELSYVYTIVDSDNNVIWGIRKDGSIYTVDSSIKDMGEKLFDLMNSVDASNKSIINNVNTSLSTLITSANNNITALQNSAGVQCVSLPDDQSYLFSIIDSNDNVIFAIRKDGSLYNSDIVGLQNNAAVKASSASSHPEYVYAIVDRNDNVIFGIRHNGTLYPDNSTGDELTIYKVKTIQEAIAKKYKNIRIGNCDLVSTVSNPTKQSDYDVVGATRRLDRNCMYPDPQSTYITNTEGHKCHLLWIDDDDYFYSTNGWRLYRRLGFGNVTDSDLLLTKEQILSITGFSNAWIRLCKTYGNVAVIQYSSETNSNICDIIIMDIANKSVNNITVDGTSRKSFGGINRASWTCINIDRNVITINDYSLYTTRRMYVSWDYGATFNKVFDFDTSNIINKSKLQGGQFHLHGSIYDRYYDRLWIMCGDDVLPNSDNPCIFWSDDKGATWNWQRCYFKDTGKTIQSVGFMCLPNAIITSTDQQVNGYVRINRTGKDSELIIDRAYTEHEVKLTHFGRSDFKRKDGVWLSINSIDPNESQSENYETFLCAIYNGYDVCKIWQDTKHTMIHTVFALSDSKNNIYIAKAKSGTNDSLDSEIRIIPNANILI